VIAAHPVAQNNAAVLTLPKNQKMIAANHHAATKIAAVPVVVIFPFIHPA